MSLLTGLESHWKLNEGGDSDNAVDYQGSNTLTQVNSPQADADIGGCRLFDPVGDQYFNIADNASLSIANIDFTIAGYFKMSTLPVAEYDLVTKREHPSSGNAEYILANTPTKFAFGTGDGAGGFDAVTSTAPDIATGSLYLVVAWHDSTAAKIYIQVNGGTPDFTARTTVPANGTSPFRLGGGLDFGFKGRMAKVSFWKRLLTTDELTWLYNSGTPRDFSEFASSPVASTSSGFFFGA